jgi:hypothetical protein
MPDSPLKLPPLQQAMLDPATVAALFADLAGCTRVLAVVPRRAARTMTEEPPIDLATAQAGLRDGSLRGVQIRYRYEDREWCDTLMAMPAGGARLVRICTDEVIASTQA